MSQRPEHTPTGDPCACGKRASQHRTRKRPEHAANGDPCTECGLAAARHRPRGVLKAQSAYVIGLDGEGVGRQPHNYVYLAAVGEDGKAWDKAGEPLTTNDCLELIMSLPSNALIVGFSLGYDHTKWLTDLTDKKLYRLFHEETRVKLIKGKRVYKPIRFGEYRLGYMNGRLTVRRGKDSRIVWDIFRFFQAAFTKALTQWGIASEAELRAMQRMKDGRATFSPAQIEEIRGYCRHECLMLSRLMRALLTAHENAGLELRDYYGAGSSGSAMLRVMRIKGQIVAPPAAMIPAVNKAFFGGRFENSVIGEIPGPIYSYDISSAYPYQTAQLPCLRHGVWRHFRGEEDVSRREAALVHWTMPYPVEGAWAPWPVRRSDGSIIYPAGGVGGWVWRDEWLAGKRMAPSAVMVEGWVYDQDCDCQPFARICQYYTERLKLGKDGRGLAIKLAVNSCYGKLAQTKGQNPPYQSFVWAGIITSHTRAMLLDAINGTNDASSVLSLATDGIFSRVPLSLPAPIDTGTGIEKPLGGWESKVYLDGVFLARPGIYWPLGVDTVADIKARGIGKALVKNKRPEIIEAFRSGADEVQLDGLIRFIGARDAISYSPVKGEYRRSSNYGEWVDQSHRITFGAGPKRASIAGQDLLLHRFCDEESQAYSKINEERAIEEGTLMVEEATAVKVVGDG